MIYNARYVAARERLIREGFGIPAAGPLAFRQQEMVRRMDPFYNYAKCRHCHEPMNNPKQHTCSPERLNMLLRLQAE